MRLTANLTLAELTKSATAKRLGIKNEPTVEHLINLKSTALNIFQPLRNHFGHPIAVTSGYRSEALNEYIKGSSRSQHTKGEAIDVDAHIFGRMTNKDIFLFIKDHLYFDQLIGEFPDENGEFAWVHVSYIKENNRGEALIAYKSEDNRTMYKRY